MDRVRTQCEIFLRNISPLTKHIINKIEAQSREIGHIGIPVRELARDHDFNYKTVLKILHFSLMKNLLEQDTFVLSKMSLPILIFSHPLNLVIWSTRSYGFNMMESRHYAVFVHQYLDRILLILYCWRRLKSKVFKNQITLMK